MLAVFPPLAKDLVYLLRFTLLLIGTFYLSRIILLAAFPPAGKSVKYALGLALVLIVAFYLVKVSTGFLEKVGPFSVVPRPQKFTDPVWNVWAEPYSETPSFRPIKLQPGHDYSVFVDLSALSYTELEKHIGYAYSHVASSAFNRWLIESKDLESPIVDILLVPDETFFAPLSGKERLKQLSIDLRKMFVARQYGFGLDEPPFQYLHSKEGKAPFRFGSVSFRIKTMDKVGFGALGLSIWADGKPVDELTFWACIVRSLDDSCGPPPNTNDSLKGVDPTHRGIYPDAALHLFDLGPDMAVVFRCNKCGWADDDYRTWYLGEPINWFSERLTEILNLIGQVPTGADEHTYAETFLHAGDALHNVLFHTRKSEQALALKAWAEFVKEATIGRDGKRGPASIFVRFVAREPNLIMVPLGLMRVDLPDGSKEFLGFLVNVETPLEMQDYTPSSQCISEWVLLVPPPRPAGMAEDQDSSVFAEVRTARQQFESWIESLEKGKSATLYQDIDQFADWLGQGMSTENNAVLILSHQEGNRLFFNSDSRSPAILSANLGRWFATPSLAIIDACGTAKPGTSEFVREFNYHGVSSVIATSTEVEPRMAGRFVALLVDMLRRRATDPTYTVGRAKFDAVRILSKEPLGAPYGPRALLFNLVGNANLRLCVAPTNVAKKETEK